MRSEPRLDLAARIAVTAGALLPYLPLLSLNHVYITDDGFASDIFNGEFPIRTLVGQLVSGGQWPVWSSSLCSGLPLTPGDPMSLGLFAALPPASALCVTVIAFVLIAAHGAYSLARRLGAERTGACLAGVAYAGSGYLVTQLKHLGIVGTVVWFPWGLFLLDRALGQLSPPRPDETEAGERLSRGLLSRLRDIGLFGLVFAVQILAGFPQSAYFCGLVYAAWSFALLLQLRARVGAVPVQVVLAPALGLAVGLAALSGAVIWMPLAELGAVSDRKGTQSWQFASMLPYSWSDALNFLLPYANGDVADGTYSAPGFFWENYGYVGMVTFLLAVFAVVRGIRRPRVGLLLAMGVGAFLMVLGPNTPVYYLAWKYLPGMGGFRFPTRFLFVVDLAICLLGAIGLGLLRPAIEQGLRACAPHLTRWAAPVLVLGTALDLFVNQSHQNPFVPASEWLSEPAVVPVLRDSPEGARLYSPAHNFFHRVAFRQARGWSELGPYRELRETVAPNTGVFWGIATADCYAGIAPSWFVDVWGDHARDGFVVAEMMRLRRDAIVGSRSFSTVLGAYGVTHLASPIPIVAPGLQEIHEVEQTHLYRLPGKRARVVSHPRVVGSNREAALHLLREGFDPDKEILLHAPVAAPETSTGSWLGRPGDASVLEEDSTHVRVRVNAPAGGYLLLADTYYPGWRATVDGVAAPALRANISLRAVRLPPNARVVDFHYEPVAFWRGLQITGLGLGAIATWLAAIGLLTWRRLRLTAMGRI